MIIAAAIMVGADMPMMMIVAIIVVVGMPVMMPVIVILPMTITAGVTAPTRSLDGDARPLPIRCSV